MPRGGGRCGGALRNTGESGQGRLPGEESKPGTDEQESARRKDGLVRGRTTGERQLCSGN